MYIMLGELMYIFTLLRPSVRRGMSIICIYTYHWNSAISGKRKTRARVKRKMNADVPPRRARAN